MRGLCRCAVAGSVLAGTMACSGPVEIAPAGGEPHDGNAAASAPYAADAMAQDGPFVVVLGVAQDGGVPQAGGEGDPAWEDSSQRRLVVSLGLADPRSGARYLFEATPDLREQLHRFESAAPHRPQRPFLDGVFLTHAHIGHYVGLVFLGHESLGAREVPVWALPRMRSFLESNGPWDQLVRYRNVVLTDLEEGVAVQLAEDVAVTAFSVPHRQEYSEVAGFVIDGPRQSVLFIPDIDSWAAWDAAGTRFEEVLEGVDVAFIDGTFWGEGEIPGRDMSAFPHPKIADSLERFSTLPLAERRKIRFIHLNHTNPALRRDGPERRAVEDAGTAIAVEGEVIPL